MGTRFGLTAQQRQLFDFVQSEITSGRGAPSFEEIKVSLGFKSKSNVHRIVDALVERGWLVKMPNRARSLALPVEVGSTPVQVSIPSALAGRLAMFCADRRQSTADVVQAALDAHLRWSA